jgi:hypothetical protein
VREGWGASPARESAPVQFPPYLLPFPQKENPFWGGNCSGRLRTSTSSRGKESSSRALLTLCPHRCIPVSFSRAASGRPRCTKETRCGYKTTKRRFCTLLERSSSPFKCHATRRQDSHPSRRNGSSTIKISSAAHDGEMCGNTHIKVARNLHTEETPYTTPRPQWDGTRNPEKHARPRDSTCEVIANTVLSIATQARGGNHAGRPPSQTTASHKADLGSRDAATRNPMGLWGSKATRQPNITGTTGRGSRNQPP